MTDLDAKGRCCGRKPLVYKTPYPGVTPCPWQFCFRCYRAFDMQGHQVESWDWLMIDGRLRPKGSPTDEQFARYHGDCDGDAGL